MVHRRTSKEFVKKQQFSIAYHQSLYNKKKKKKKKIVQFTQLCSKFPPTALLNLTCDWLALDRDISFGRLTSPNV